MLIERVLSTGRQARPIYFPGLIGRGKHCAQCLPGNGLQGLTDFVARKSRRSVLLCPLWRRDREAASQMQAKPFYPEPLGKRYKGVEVEKSSNVRMPSQWREWDGYREFAAEVRMQLQQCQLSFHQQWFFKFFLLYKTYIYIHIYPLTHWYLNLPEPDMTGWSSAETDRVDEDASSKMESIALGYAILQKIKREVRGRKDNFSKIKLCTRP